MLQHAAHGKQERAETADEMLDRLLQDMNTENTPAKEQGKKQGTIPQDSTRRSSMQKFPVESRHRPVRVKEKRRIQLRLKFKRNPETRSRKASVIAT